MSQNNPPALPPPPIIHTTAGQILKQTSSIFYSHILTFVLLATLVLAFRSNVLTASHYLSSLIDTDPSLKSLLSRLDLSARVQDLSRPRPHPRRRSFLHLSRVGALDDDFFSGDSDFERSLFHEESRKPTPNSTFLFLSTFKPDWGFSHSITDDGISFAEKVKPRVFGGLKMEFRNNVTFQKEEVVEVVDHGSHDSESGSLFDLEFFLKGLELGNRDATSLFFFVGVLSATYAYVVFGFIVTYTWISGITFLKVVDHLLGKHRSFLRIVWDGSFIGLRKLSGFILMRWAIRDAMAQVMGILFFGEIEDQYVFFKIFLRLKFLPFANLAPWVIGHELESSYFIAFWFLSDLILGFIFAIVSWVTIVESRRGGREILTDTCHLILLLFGPAFKLRFLEAVICGWCGRWVLRKMFGDFSTLVIQSLMEVYFLVAWLVFYLAAKHKNETSLGRTFGRRELEGFLEAAR